MDVEKEETLDLLGNRFIAPRKSPHHRLTAALSNSKLIARCRRKITSFFPFLQLRSDVKNVVYMNWVIETEKVRHLVPNGLELWEQNGMTLFTILTYRHGSFGPSFLGPFRRLFFSPLQSNWRLYLKSAPPNMPEGSTVLFLKNTMSSHLYALGTRVFSDVLATHLPRTFIHKQKDGIYETGISPGKGSAPKLKSFVKASDEKKIDAEFSKIFDSWEEVVEFLSFQDAAVSYTDRDAVFAFSQIQLPIDTATIQPLEMQPEKFSCPMLDDFAPVSEPLCYVIPKVEFLATSETLFRLK